VAGADDYGIATTPLPAETRLQEPKQPASLGEIALTVYGPLVAQIVSSAGGTQGAQRPHLLDIFTCLPAVDELAMA